ncbi:MAG: histidine phosphatase family protein [Desulfovibrionaceae bacterium]
MSRTVYYLIRHATTLWNLEKRIQGHWDCELSPEGTAEAKALAPRLAGLNLSRILCSDLGRAKSTAGIFNLTLRLPVTLEKRLREQQFGQWTGKYWRDIPAETLKTAEAAGWEFRPPGGESREDVRQRAEHALIDAARGLPGRNVLVVTHQGVLKSVLYHLLGRDFLPHEPPAFDPNRLQQLVCQDGVLSIGGLDLEPPTA